ncbi:MAG TPA: pilus assembly protein PilM [Bdellovibrionales bacterium]|nr:pilus assembly protein PilM [Bdellovibrionales bacterium]
MRSIGIDIGTFSIKVAEVEATTRSIALLDCFEVALDPDPSRDPHVQIVDVLRQLTQRYAPSKYKYVFALPESQVSIRQKIFPFRERHKILRSLPFELEDDVPFTQDNAVFDAKILHYRKNATEVLAMATPKPYVQKILDLAGEGYADPDLVSVEAAGLANLVEDVLEAPTENDDHQSDEQPQESQDVVFHPQPASVLLHIGHQHTVLCVFHLGTLVSARTIFWGGVQVVRAIAKQYNMPFAEALKGLVEKGFVLTSNDGVTKEQTVFSNTITSSLYPLIDEVKRALLDIQSEFKVNFERIDLTGGVTQLINLPAFLTQGFELPCNLIKPFQNIDRNSADISDALVHRAGLAIGLAIEGVRRPTNPAVNFRKNELAKENQTYKLLWEKWRYTVQLAAAAFVLFFVYSFIRDSFALSLSDKAYDALRDRAQQGGLKRNQASLSGIERYIREKQREIRAKKTLAELQDVNSALDIMNRVSSVMPAKEQIQLDVRRFYVLNEYLTLEGEVSRRESVEQIQRAITSLAVDRQVKELAPSFKPQGGRIAFAYTLKVSRKGSRQ